MFAGFFRLRRFSQVVLFFVSPEVIHWPSFRPSFSPNLRRVRLRGYAYDGLRCYADGV